MTATLRLTHYGHACVLAELPDGTRILFDPGTYSADFEDLAGLDAVLVTHEHPDHCDAGRLPLLLGANPGARVVTIAEADDSVTVGGAVVRVGHGEHAVVHPALPNVANNAYQVDGLLFHPGDSFALPQGPIHGDAHTRNLLTDHGQVVLLDFESAAVGPRAASSRPR